MKNLTLTVKRNDAINLIYICVAQLFFYTFESGLIDLLKFVFLIGSVGFAALMLYKIYTKRGQKKLTFRIIVFLIFYNTLLLLSSIFLGGIITFVIGVLAMGLLIKIDD